MAPRIQIIPEKLRAARKKAGNGSKSAAAAAAGLSWPGYSNWESGEPRRDFDYNAFVALCDYLGVDPSEITEEIPEGAESTPDPLPESEQAFAKASGA